MLVVGPVTLATSSLAESPNFTDEFFGSAQAANRGPVMRRH